MSHPFPVCAGSTNTEFVLYTEEDDDLLPAFPLEKPAAFQILESDCKMSEALGEQLRFKYMSCAHSDLDAFIGENLDEMLTAGAAAIFSWTGKQGTISIMKFKTIEILIGLWSSVMAFGRPCDGSLAPESST